MRNMTHAKLLNHLTKLGACREALAWLKKNKYDLKEAWKNCGHPLWMLWWLERMPGISQKKLNLITTELYGSDYDLAIDELRRVVRVTK